MWHVYWFVNIPIRKRLIFVPIQIGVWYILAKNIAFWLVDLMQPFFRAWRDFTASQRWFLKQQFCLTDLKVRFFYATMNAWIQIWVQGEMCGNNTIKLEWHIYNVSISPKTALVKKYTPCHGVFWSQYRLSGTFYVSIIFGVVLFAKVCFFLPMQFWKAVDFTLSLLYLNFKLQYLMNYSSNFNNFCRFQLLAVCTTWL